MASRTNSAGAERRFTCDQPGCKKLYLRSEHLNRHRLTHKQRAFACYFCERKFTRNDLLQAHLRRHENKSLENHEKRRGASPPHQGHRDGLLRRTNPLWDEDPSPMLGAIGMDPGSQITNDTISDLNTTSRSSAPLVGPGPPRPHTLPEIFSQRSLLDTLTRKEIDILQMVRDRLANGSWEIGREASQILDKLLGNYNSGP